MAFSTIMFSLAFAPCAKADDLALLEDCLRLSASFEDASQVFANEVNPEEKVSEMRRIYGDFRIYRGIVEIAGGSDSKHELASYRSEENALIGGTIFSSEITPSVAGCELTDKAVPSCADIEVLLERTSVLMEVACNKDYERAIH